MSTLPIAEVKAHLSELADRVENEQDLITVTRNGRPSFHMISSDELEGLRETIAILSDPELAASVLAARREAEAGEGMRMTREEAEAMFAARARD